MKILALDTALGACSVAILDGDRVLAHTHEEMQRGHAEALAPMTQAAMHRAGLAFADLERLAVTTGPGTFTGQRVGLAFMRAMALALKIPAAGVTTLDAMAEEALARSPRPWALVAIDAKRDEVYLGARARGRTLLAPVLKRVETAAETALGLAAVAGPEFVLAGTGAALLMPLLSPHVQPELGPVRQPDAVFVARLGREAVPTGAAPRPLYLRASDAKLPARA